MRIGELAERAGTTTKTLRFYEQAGLLPEPERTASGYRDYDERMLDRLAFVKAAQAAGLTLAEIGEVVAVRNAHGPPCEHVTGLLDRHAGDLAAAQCCRPPPPAFPPSCWPTGRWRSAASWDSQRCWSSASACGRA